VEKKVDLYAIGTVGKIEEAALTVTPRFFNEKARVGL